VARSTIATTDHREEYPFGHPPPTEFPASFFVTTEPRQRRAFLIVDSVHRGNSFFTVLLHNQGYPKVCPDSLNLSNAGDPFCWNIIAIFLFFVFPDQGLNCFDLESSRVFSVNFPEPSLFQISELLHFIDFRKKF
jgi:hypothetical protein